MDLETLIFLFIIGSIFIFFIRRGMKHKSKYENELKIEKDKVLKFGPFSGSSGFYKKD